MHPTSRQVNPVAAAFCGAVVALVLGYGGSYFLALLGAGIVQDSSGEHGVATLRRAALDLYAMLHARLSGEGTVGGSIISASVTLPLTLWVLVPLAALVVGGYAAGRLRAGTGRWSIVVPAALGGFFYAAMLAALAGLAGARIEPSALPAVEGFEFNPPPIVFRPEPWSAFVAGLIFGTIATYLGGLAALKADRPREDRPGRWWSSAKALVLVLVLVQVLIAVGVVFLFFSRPEPGEDQGMDGLTLAAMLPTATGIGYSLIHGATMAAGVESLAPGFESSAFGASYTANLYGGTSSTRGDEVERARVPAFLLVLPLLAAAALWLAGWLAVRWGSQDGAVPTALRLTLLHAAYLVFALWACRVLWEASESSEGVRSQYQVFISPQFDVAMLWPLIGVFFVTLWGAAVSMRRQRGLGFMLP